MQLSIANICLDNYQKIKGRKTMPYSLSGACVGKYMTRVAAVLAGALCVAPAFAHDGDHATLSLAAGFLHAFSSLDHVLAMLAVVVGLMAALNVTGVAALAGKGVRLAGIGIAASGMLFLAVV
jgi:hydrogenase/urease accessory protein HupE